MKYRRYLLILLFWGLNACLIQPNELEVMTIGIVNLTPGLEAIVDGLKEGMTDLGYIEGENIEYIYEGPTGNIDLLEEAARDVVSKEVDLLISVSTPATFAAKNVLAETEVPLLFVPTYDPVSNGIVNSIAMPGGNYTGIQTIGFIPKQLEWLVIIDPSVDTIFVPHNPVDGASIQGLATLQESAEQLNINLIVQEVMTPDALIRALGEIPIEADAIFMLPDGLVSSHLEEFIAVGLETNLPVAAINPSHVEAGALVSFGWGLSEVGRSQVARMADQILQGISASEIPVETSEFFLTINLQTANAIGLTVDEEILPQAKFIYR